MLEGRQGQRRALQLRENKNENDRIPSHFAKGVLCDGKVWAGALTFPRNWGTELSHNGVLWKKIGRWCSRFLRSSAALPLDTPSVPAGEAGPGLNSPVLVSEVGASDNL